MDEAKAPDEVRHTLMLVIFQRDEDEAVCADRSELCERSNADAINRASRKPAILFMSGSL